MDYLNSLTILVDLNIVLSVRLLTTLIAKVSPCCDVNSGATYSILKLTLLAVIKGPGNVPSTSVALFKTRT